MRLFNQFDPQGTLAVGGGTVLTAIGIVFRWLMNHQSDVSGVMIWVGGVSMVLGFCRKAYAQHHRRKLAKRGLFPLECLKCGEPNGPVHPIDGDHPGYLCPECYKLIRLSSHEF